MSKVTLMSTVIFLFHSICSNAQWTKIDDPTLELVTIVRYKYDTGFILGYSLKQGVVISKDVGSTFQKFKSSIVPNAYYVENDTIYVGGYYNKVQYTADFGLTFKDITTDDIKNHGVSCFAKYDNNIILVGTIRNGIYSYNKTTKQWLNIGHKNKKIDAILVKDKTIIATVEFQDVSKSTDFGTTWQSLIPTNNNPATDLIYYKGNIIMSTIGTGMKISYDHGEKWESINLGLSTTTLTGNSLALSKDGNHLFMIGYGEGVFYFNDLLKKWEDISNDLTLSKKGEDIAISGNKIFTDGFPIPFDNTSYIYSLNFDGIFTSSKEVSPNSHNIKIFPNPSTNALNIMLDDEVCSKENVVFIIYDINFREIAKFNCAKSSIFSIDLTTFKNGYYILKTKLNHEYYFSKFLKI